MSDPYEVAVGRRPTNSQRTELGDLRNRRSVQAHYDAAQTTDEHKNYWKHADSFDADSAHNKQVRHTLIRRSRYEVANNGYSDGIAQTYATDTVGSTGPKLRMQTGNKNFNQMVERTWRSWAKAIHFRRKLWCMAHAKHTDGEALAVVRRNPGIGHRIKLDLVLYEAEQCQTPYVPIAQRGYIDGIQFDQFGNPTYYDFLHEHPGATGVFPIDLVPEKVPASRVLHWFKLRRPGQHRAVPEMASTLNLGAAARRFREANLSTAEKVAAWTMFLKTQFEPEELDSVAPMSSLDILHGMMTALPNSMEPYQLKAEHPSPAYDAFNKSLINEQGRPKSMPLNKTACNSADYNYASGRLDHQTYYGSLDVDREDCDDTCLDKLFPIWFELAVLDYGWLGGNPDALSELASQHTWDWPQHRVADIKSEAQANEIRLRSGQISYERLYADSGVDFEDELEAMARGYRISTEEMAHRLLDGLFKPEAPEPEGEDDGDLEERMDQFKNRLRKVSQN